MITLSTAAELAQLTRTPDQPGEADLGDLRTWLNEQLLDATDGWDRPAGLLGITKGRVLSVMRCPATILGDLEERKMNEALALGTIVDAAASLLLMTNKLPGDAPWLGAVIAALGDGDREVVRFVERLSTEARDNLRSQVQEKCELLEVLLGDVRQCEGTAQERFRVQFTEPGVQLTGRTDLVLGAIDRSILEVKSGRFGPHLNDELRFYALLATLRDQRSPVAVAALTLGDGVLTTLEVTIDLLEAGAQRVIDAARVLVQVDQATVAGRWPETMPSRLCSWCRAAPRCPDVPDVSLAEFEAARAEEHDFVDVDEDEPW